MTQGGGIAAPVASQVLGEIMPYLEIENANTEVKENIEMPNITGLTVKEAKKILKDLELDVEISEEITEESIVKKQIPGEGISINIGTKVFIGID